LGLSKKKKFQNGRRKKPEFFNIPQFSILFQKFLGLVLGLVELIDVKSIDVAYPIWL
jgi:hypothetical protein